MIIVGRTLNRRQGEIRRLVYLRGKSMGCAEQEKQRLSSINTLTGFPVADTVFLDTGTRGQNKRLSSSLLGDQGDGYLQGTCYPDLIKG